MPPPSADLKLWLAMRSTFAMAAFFAWGTWLGISSTWIGGVLCAVLALLAAICFWNSLRRYRQRRRDPHDRREETELLAAMPQRFQEIPVYATGLMGMSLLCVGLAITNAAWGQSGVLTVFAFVFADAAQVMVRDYFRWKNYFKSQPDHPI